MSNEVNIISIIDKNPGIKFREIMRETGMKNGVLSYHARKLEKNGIVKVERTSGITRFYPLGMKSEEIILIKHLRQRLSYKIIAILIENQNLTFKNIMEMTHVSCSSASISLSKLVRDNIVNIKFEKRTKLYQIKKEEFVKKIINKYYHDILECLISEHKKILTSILFVFSLSQRFLFDQSLDVISRISLF